MKKIILLSVLLGLTSTAQAQQSKLDKLSMDVYPEVVELRRWFHENPELSNREFNTSKRIVAELEKLGLKPEAGIAKTGVVALLKGGKPGPTVALRADIDALPVTEETGLPFASKATSEFAGKEVGVMHACGHDSHIAMLLGAAKVLTDIQDELQGNVLFIFQPAEEGAPAGEEGGAELMLKEGLFKKYKPEVVFGMHVGLNMPGGTIAVRPGPAMASVDILEIKVTGKQTHGARPWGGVDPIVTSAQIINALQTIVSRQTNITKAPAIVTIGKIDGGVRHNIIPDEVLLWGTIRNFDMNIRDDIHKSIKKIARLTAESAGAKAEVDIQRGYPVTINDPDLTAKMMPTLERVSGDKAVVTPDLVTGAEDFSFFANEVPGVFLFLGSVSPDEDPKKAYSNHSPYFTIHEPIMQTGVSAFVNMTVDYMEMVQK